MTPTLPVVLCGGSGTRLWPLSRSSFPKQFAPLIGGKSLLELTLRRVAPLGERVVCVAAEDHRYLVSEAMAAAGVAGTVLLEPAPRNTAPAMALAALYAPDSLLLFCPSDHHVPDQAAFTAMVAAGQAAAMAGSIVLFGVQPSWPSTAYGYLHADGAGRVTRFVEKPRRDAAERMLLEGGYLWNSGMFLVHGRVLLDALRRHAPDVLAAVEGAAQTPDGQFVRPGASFADCRAVSIDYAVMEHHDDIVVIPFAGQWSDVGSWNAVAELTPADADGNRVGAGRGWHIDAHNTYIHAADRPVVALGTSDLLIIDTPDALLVADAARAEQVKDVVAALHRDGVTEAHAHRKVVRPWGWYDAIDRGHRFQVKRICVDPGAGLSLQLHHRRAEHWIVVRGTARVTRGDTTLLVHENESTFIPQGERHRLENPGEIPLEIIEVQSGEYLGEDDIVRLDDHYGRDR